MTEVHATAIVDPNAELATDVVVGPFCVIGPAVRLGQGVRLESHVVVTGRTRIGPGCRIFPFACLGHRPQDLKFRGEETELVIGSNNQIREHVTMHPGTVGGGGVTRVGDDGLYMAAIHVAHDCQLGNGVIMANNATLGGHVHIEDEALLGGVCAVHQFVRIGRQAMIGGLAGVENDVIPYGVALRGRSSTACVRPTAICSQARAPSPSGWPSWRSASPMSRAWSRSCASSRAPGLGRSACRARTVPAEPPCRRSSPCWPGPVRFPAR